MQRNQLPASRSSRYDSIIFAPQLNAINSLQVSAEDREKLDQLFDPEITQKIIDLHLQAIKKPTTRPGEFGRVQSGIVTDKILRTNIHQEIRRIFRSELESTTEHDGQMVISAAPVSVRRPQPKQKKVIRGGDERANSFDVRGGLAWKELGGDYVHFTIYKENRDTMEVVYHLARQLKMTPKQFHFAGTKDRRGVTVQRGSAYRIHPNRIVRANGGLRNAVIGDIDYRKHNLELGDLGGNEFVITIRDCQFPADVAGGIGEDTVSKVTSLFAKSLGDLRERGYFNYYGLQRFGTFAARTDTTGLKMLQGDFKGACDTILHYDPAALAAAENAPSTSSDTTKPIISPDDIARAKGIHIFQTTGDVKKALEFIPRKFNAESTIIRQLKQRKHDYLGALQSIPRNLRLMYVHAYQSLVWNFAVGERWRLYGDKVVAGDLVLVGEFKGDGADNAADTAELDADGEDIVLPDIGDSAPSAEDMFERARALTAEEAASGKYSIFDIVLPLPGFDILYPSNEMTEFYKRFMGSDKGGNLDPFDMRRKWRDVSLSGGYRKMLSRPGPEYSFEVKRYTEEDEQFVTTDLDVLKQEGKVKGAGNRGKQDDLRQGDKERNDEQGAVAVETTTSAEKKEKLAVVLKFRLGPSQYATMALRELMKTGGAKMFKPEFARAR